MEQYSTHLNVRDQYKDNTVFVISEEQYLRLINT